MTLKLPYFLSNHLTKILFEIVIDISFSFLREKEYDKIADDTSNQNNLLQEILFSLLLFHTINIKICRKLYVWEQGIVLTLNV